MKSLKKLFVPVMFMALVIPLSASPQFLNRYKDAARDASGFRWPGGQNQNRWGDPFFWRNPRLVMTCDKSPNACKATGNPWPDCCKKRCVDVMTDPFNCGRCGRMCKYSEMCCQGACVNTFSDENHCGWCDNKCEKKTSCMYGFCSYA